MSNSTFAHAVYGVITELTAEERSQLSSLCVELDVHEDSEELKDMLIGEYDMVCSGTDKAETMAETLKSAVISRVCAELDLPSPESLEADAASLMLHYVHEAASGSQVESGSFIVGFGMLCFPALALSPNQQTTAFLRKLMELSNGDKHLQVGWHSWVT